MLQEMEQKGEMETTVIIRRGRLLNVRKKRESDHGTGGGGGGGAE